MVTMRILDKYVVGCVTCTKDISWIGNKLCEKHPELDFVLLFSQGKVSGRTVKTADAGDGKYKEEDYRKRRRNYNQGRRAGSGKD